MSDDIYCEKSAENMSVDSNDLNPDARYILLITSEKEDGIDDMQTTDDLPQPAQAELDNTETIEMKLTTPEPPVSDEKDDPERRSLYTAIVSVLQTQLKKPQMTELGYKSKDSSDDSSKIAEVSNASSALKRRYRRARRCVGKPSKKKAKKETKEQSEDEGDNAEELIYEYDADDEAESTSSSEVESADEKKPPKQEETQAAAAPAPNNTSNTTQTTVAILH